MGYRCRVSAFFVLWIDSSDASFSKLRTTFSAAAKGFPHCGVGEQSFSTWAYCLWRKNNKCSVEVLTIILRHWSPWEWGVITGRKKSDICFETVIWYLKSEFFRQQRVCAVYKSTSLKHHDTARICPWWEVVILVFMSADKNGSWGRECTAELIYCPEEQYSLLILHSSYKQFLLLVSSFSLSTSPHRWHSQRLTSFVSYTVTKGLEDNTWAGLISVHSPCCQYMTFISTSLEIMWIGVSPSSKWMYSFSLWLSRSISVFVCLCSGCF